MTRKQIKEYSIKDIAALSGISIATLSRYFNGQSIRKSNEEKIRAVIEKTNYKPNIAARFMKGQRTGIIGLILPKLTHYFFSAVAEGIMEEASRNGLAVLCASCQGSEKEENEIIEQFSHSILDGLIYIPVARAKNIPSIESFRNLPLVIAARRNLFPNIPHVYHNGEKGGYLATRFLLQMGRKHIAFVASFWNPPCKTGAELLQFLNDPYSSTFSSCDRLRGYIKALSEANIEINPNLIIISTYSAENGKDAATAILGQMGSCTGIILMDPIIATGCTEQLRSQGLNIPNDISIVIFDAKGRNGASHFSKIELQLKKMGEESVKALKNVIDNKSVHDIALDVTLVPDKTTTVLKNK